MQKVEGSSPFIRFEKPCKCGLFSSPVRRNRVRAVSEREAANAFGENPPATTELATDGEKNKRAAAVGRSIKKFGRLCLSALRDGPTRDESWRMANGETWEQIQHPNDGDDI